MPVVKLTVLTQSELGAFRTCRKRWWFGYEQGLRPLRRARALEVGTAVHEGLRVLYSLLKAQPQMAIDEVSGLAVEQTRKRIDLFRDALMEDYVEKDHEQRALVAMESATARDEALAAIRLYCDAFAEHDAREYTVELVEHKFDVPIGSGRSRARLKGMLDLVLRHKRTGTLWLNEHKSTKQDAHLMDARLDVDGQVRAYLMAMRHIFGEKVGGVMLNCVRKVAPKHPKINKNGTVSVAACDTTRGIYLQALDLQKVERGKEITEEQLSFAASLPERTDRWVSRHEHYVTEREVNEWIAEAIAETKLLRAAQAGKLAITRNPATCVQSWQPACPFRSICVDDSPARREAEFRVGERHEELADDMKTTETGGS